jgi:hypothetical protein
MSNAMVRRTREVVRRVVATSLLLGLVTWSLAGALAPATSSAATSKDRTLFAAVSTSYDATLNEFNLVIDSFSACPTAKCVGAASEGASDTRLYQATLALEKKGPYPSGVAKSLNIYVGNLINIQKDINAVDKAKTINGQKTVVSNKLELDVDNLAFRGIQILIYLGEQKKY